MKNQSLHSAKKAKNDEFYTQLKDIENELRHYKDQLCGKVIFCNCDDPRESNFTKYFELNFEHLGIKKLITTHFEATKPSYKLEITGDRNGDGKVDSYDVKQTPLKQNGDFRSPECIEILKEADVVITNPPFSLFREYVAQLVEYNKKFLIIGNKNALTYKEIFKLIKENKLWAGYRGFSGGMWFYTEHEVATTKIDENGNRLSNVPSIWLTNLNTTKRHEPVTLYKRYSPEEYPGYDNYDAIEVSKVSDIPLDYSGAMGVPITFIDKYNPNQFEIIGQTGVDIKLSKGRPYINGRRMYARVLIKRKEKNER
jgi:hypothetical protein